MKGIVGHKGGKKKSPTLSIKYKGVTHEVDRERWKRFVEARDEAVQYTRRFRKSKAARKARAKQRKLARRKG